MLGVLASSPVLDRGDPAAFRDVALRVLATLPDWRAVVLHDPQGRTLMHSGFPEAPPPPSEEESLRIAVAERRPIVGFLRRGPGGEWAVPVRYPVIRDGAVRYVVSGVLKPEAVLAVLQRQRLPDDWVVSVFDARDARIARSRAHEASVGLGPSPELQALMASRAPEGLGVTDTIDGQRVYTAYVRLRDAGWTVAGGLPTSASDADLRKAVTTYVGALVVSLLLAVVLALRFANRINRPMEQLRDVARQFGGSGGAPPQAVQTGIVEVDDVARTLVAAARERSQGEAEREALLAAERQARAAAEAARNRLELLAESGARLARSLDPEATLQAVANTIVPAIVDWCNIDLADDDGHLHRALVHHADPARRSRVQALLLRTRPLASMEGSMAWAAQTGGSHIARYDSPQAHEASPTPTSAPSRRPWRCACTSSSRWSLAGAPSARWPWRRPRAGATSAPTTSRCSPSWRSARRWRSTTRGSTPRPRARARRAKPPTARRTSSSPCSATSCATRSAPIVDRAAS